MLSDRNNNPRLLLAKVRKGDYTHAGDEEAIDLFLEHIDALNQQPYKNIKALDIGCGLGGTANYIHEKTALAICGIDKDISAINHAKKHYSAITFFQCDVEHLNQHFEEK